MSGPLVYDGQIIATWVPTIADIDNPSAVEIAAGQDYTSYLPKDGISFPSTRNMVDTGSLDETFDGQYPGTAGGPLSITFKQQNNAGESAAASEFIGARVEGYWVFGYNGSNDTAADVVDVYQAASHDPVRGNPAANTEQRFTVEFGVQSMRLGVTVAA